MKSYQTAAGYAIPNGTTANYYYQVKDWLGTAHVTLDAAGGIKNAMDYYPYGKKLPGRNAFSTNQEGYRYQFTGHEFDGETGYQYHGARYYNEELARYMSVDPLAMQFHAWSPYNYVMANPNIFIDPSGKGPEDAQGESGKKSPNEDNQITQHFKRLSKLQQRSDRLSAREQKQADRYVAKKGGFVQHTTDSYGNDRYSVQSVSFQKESNNPFDLDRMDVATKTFNNKKWKAIKSGQQTVLNDIRYTAEQFANRASNTRDVYGINLGAALHLFGGGGDNVSVVYFTRGPDKGFHFFNTVNHGFGVEASAGVGVFGGDHIGRPKDMFPDYLGVGVQFSGKAIGGVSVSTGIDTDRGTATWLNAGFSFGPSVGTSIDATITTPIGE